MTIKSNPYGVGYSGTDLEMRNERCVCCEFPFQYQVVRNQPALRSRCDSCADHYWLDGEEAERTIARLSDHEVRFRERVVKVSEVASRYERDLKRSKEQVAAALTSRDSWREIASDMYLAHEGQSTGECSCGSRYPCATVKVVQGCGAGLQRELERRASER